MCGCVYVCVRVCRLFFSVGRCELRYVPARVCVRAIRRERERGRVRVRECARTNAGTTLKKAHEHRRREGREGGRIALVQDTDQSHFSSSLHSRGAGPHPPQKGGERVVHLALGMITCSITSAFAVVLGGKGGLSPWSGGVERITGVKRKTSTDKTERSNREKRLLHNTSTNNQQPLKANIHLTS